MLNEMLPPDANLLIGQRIRPLKRVEFDRLSSAGCFDEERVELLFGMVVEMGPPSPEHDTSVFWTQRYLERRLGDRAMVRCQSAFDASEISQPKPDVFVVPNGDYWRTRPARAFLVVEISRASLERDRAKRELYAQGQVDEYWIVNHDKRVVEVYRAAIDGMWSQVSVHRIGETIAMLAFPDVHVAVGEILPPIG